MTMDCIVFGIRLSCGYIRGSCIRCKIRPPGRLSLSMYAESMRGIKQLIVVPVLLSGLGRSIFASDTRLLPQDDRSAIAAPNPREKYSTRLEVVAHTSSFTSSTHYMIMHPPQHPPLFSPSFTSNLPVGPPLPDPLPPPAVYPAISLL